MLTDADRVPLAARAWIADGVRGALVAADGTIDWYCPDGFGGAPALFHLLDPAGAAVRVGPVRQGTGSARRLPPGEQGYRPGTMVAETTLRTGSAVLRVDDALAWPGASGTPSGRLVRVATALGGPVDVEVEVLPGRLGGPEQRVETWSEGLVVGPLAVRAGIRFEPAPLGRDRPRWRAVCRLDAGESLTLTLDPAGARVEPLAADAARRLLDDTAAAWRSWSAPLAVAGPYAAAVARSALVVRSLTGPAGAPVAAGTTSLPRRPGGERTADDRVVRLRDAAAAARALARAGLDEDAEAAERWLREAIEAATPPWPVALAPGGGAVPDGDELPLAGWRRGQPVVVGRGGRTGPGLPDLDLSGDLELAVSASHRGPWGDGGAGPLSGAAPALAAGADWVADHWERPDAGVWALSGPPVRLVPSAVQAWVALDRAARRARAADPLDLAAATWLAESRRVVTWLEAEGVAADGGLRRAVGAGGGADDSDAALLRVAWQGPWPADHPVVRATVDRVLERHASGLLLHRLPEGVDDGRPGPDSPDLLASLWAVRALARVGRWEEGHERMEAVLALAGPTGLLAEAADPVAGELLGNLPAAGVHLALLDAAADLAAGPR